MTCRSVLGWIFGHKFIDGAGNVIRADGRPICQRCGKTGGS